MRKDFVFVFLLLFTVVGVAQPPIPQLPQTYLDTTFNPPTGVTRPVHTSTEFKNALVAANPGDTIVLDAGSTYQGNFTPPAKSNPNNKWIYIISNQLAQLPAGTRVTPANASAMPKLSSPNVTATITLAPGANHYRFSGLEITTSNTTVGCNPNHIPPVNCYTYELIYPAMAMTGPMNDSITVDRCYLHASPTIDVQHAIIANGSNFAVIDSYISDIHDLGTDSQAIGEWFSPGPIKIVNNYLSSSSEDILLGGAGGINNPYVASDVEVRNNYFYKPLAWAKVGVSIQPNATMVVKNHFEIKRGQRVLLDGNTFENIWASGQSGFSIMLTPIGGALPAVAVVDDVTISNNIFKNVGSGFDVTSFDSNCLAANGCTNTGETKRVVFYNNLFMLGDTTQVGYTNGYAWGGLLNEGITDFVVQHNTVIPPPNLGYCKASLYFSIKAPINPPVSHTHNVWILDNVLCRQLNGPAGMVGQFSYVLSDYMGDPPPPDPRLLGNVFYAPPGDKVYPLPPHNYSTDVKFTNSKGSEYQLKHPAKMETTDGRIAGVDKSKLASAYSAESGIKLPTRSEAPTVRPEKKQ